MAAASIATSVGSGALLAAGKVTGDKKLQTEGKMDKAKGAAHEAAGDIKDAVRKAGE